MYIKNRRDSYKFELNRSYKSWCSTESFVLRNRLLFIYQPLPTIMKNLIILLISISILSCKDEKQVNKKVVEEKIETKIKKVESKPNLEEITENFDPIKENLKRIENENIIVDKELVDFNDLYSANKKNIISVYPNEKEIEEMKSESGEEDFYIVADDINFYSFEAEEFLKSRSMKSYSTDKRFIQFIMKDEDTVYVDTDKIESKWIMILCDGYDKPYSSSLIDIEMNFQELDE